MEVFYKRSDCNDLKRMPVSPNNRLYEFRDTALSLNGWKNIRYKLVLERTNKELEDSLTFEEAGVKPSDTIVLIISNKTSTNEESQYQDNVPRNTELSEIQTSSNLKAWQKVLKVLIAVILGILGFGSLLYMATQQQQAILIRELKEARILIRELKRNFQIDKTA